MVGAEYEALKADCEPTPRLEVRLFVFALCSGCRYSCCVEAAMAGATASMPMASRLKVETASVLRRKPDLCIDCTDSSPF